MIDTHQFEIKKYVYLKTKAPGSMSSNKTLGAMLHDKHDKKE